MCSISSMDFCALVALWHFAIEMYPDDRSLSVHNQAYENHHEVIQAVP